MMIKLLIFLDMFQKLFYPAYAITIFKSQGSTFDYPQTIHEWTHPLFDNRLKYVSAARATDTHNGTLRVIGFWWVIFYLFFCNSLTEHVRGTHMPQNNNATIIQHICN